MEEAKEPKQPKEKLSLKLAWLIVLIVGVGVIGLMAYNLYKNRTQYVKYGNGISDVSFEYPKNWLAQEVKSSDSATQNGTDFRVITIYGPGTYAVNPPAQGQEADSYAFSILVSKVSLSTGPQELSEQYGNIFPDGFGNPTDYVADSGIKMKIRSVKAVPNANESEDLNNNSTNATFNANGYSYFVMYGYPTNSNEGMDPAYAAAFYHLLDTFQPQFVSTY